MTGKKRRGFAAMSPEMQRAISARGGRAAHKKGVAYELTPEKAAEIGKKGGASVSQDREWMSKIGRVGGSRRTKRKKK